MSFLETSVPVSAEPLEVTIKLITSDNIQPVNCSNGYLHFYNVVILGMKIQ